MPDELDAKHLLAMAEDHRDAIQSWEMEDRVLGTLEALTLAVMANAQATLQVLEEVKRRG